MAPNFFFLVQLENLCFFIEIIYAGHTGFDKFRALGSLQFFLEHSLDENIIIIIIKYYYYYYYYTWSFMGQI